MSDPTPGPKSGSRARLPYHLAPWLAVAAMAAATLWPKGRKKTSALAQAQPRLLTPAELDKAEPGRGRAVHWPTGMPLLAWKDILWRTYREMGRDRLGALAGGITYYILLATFPAIAAFVSLYGLIADPGEVERQISHMSVILPTEAVSLIGAQMERIAAQRHTTLGAAFVVSTLLSLWSANAGMKSMVDALNITFDEVEKRDYVRRSFLTYIATVAAIAFLIVVFSVLVAAPVFFHDMGLRRFGVWWGPVRWMVVAVTAASGFTLLYRYGPSRKHARWRWVAFGGVLAAMAWMGVSLTFSWYLNHFAHLGITYGSLGAIIAYMLWVWISSMVILTGAEFNAEIEHQTAIDTTIGAVRPLGDRGAVMADTIGNAFTMSPREAVHYWAEFGRRQVGYVSRFVRRLVGARA